MNILWKIQYSLRLFPFLRSCDLQYFYHSFLWSILLLHFAHLQVFRLLFLDFL